MILLDGSSLTLEDLMAIAHDGAPVGLAAAARARVRAARALVDARAAGDEPAYGINTGFGSLSDVRIPRDQLAALQLNLIRSHAAGVGEPLPVPAVRATMALRANVLAKGYSGVREATIEALMAALNAGVHPRIPSRGSVGASGDLAPLAHLALVLVGEGAVLDRTLADAGLAPVALEAKEGLALINGTQPSAAVLALAWHAAMRLADASDVAAAMSIDALRGSAKPFDPRIHEARPYAGQRTAARRIAALLVGSAINDSHANCGRVQDAYCLRCAAQVHGAARDALAFVEQTLLVEANAGTDNPMVFVTGDERADGRRPVIDTTSGEMGASEMGAGDIVAGEMLAGEMSASGMRSGEVPSGEILSGGNFHGAPVAIAADLLAIAVTHLATISERRTDRLLDTSVSGLPPFLTEHSGLHSGLMMAQVTAAALASELKTLAHPASVDTIPTSAGKEDHVSMSMGAALKAARAVEVAQQVVAIELLCASQGIDLLRPLSSSPAIERVHAVIRADVPRLTDDRAPSPDIGRIAARIADGSLQM